MSNVALNKYGELEDAGASCPKCGKPVEPDWVKCPYCEAKLEPASCPQCKRPLKAGWKTCPTCGDEKQEITPDEFLEACRSGDVAKVRRGLMRDPKLAGACDSNIEFLGCQALHYACLGGHKDIVLALLDAGADVNAGSIMNPPLHIAAFWGHVEIVQLLIGAGADVCAKDDDGMTPLEHAEQAGHKQVAAILRAFPNAHQS